jgi:hypothetical protein
MKPHVSRCAKDDNDDKDIIFRSARAIVPMLRPEAALTDDAVLGVVGGVAKERKPRACARGFRSNPPKNLTIKP